ncbi:PAS domain-containing protein, partial [Methylobacterium hispanicum]
MSQASSGKPADPGRERDFGLVFEAGAEAMLVLDPEADRIIDANAAAARLLGHPRAALRGMAASGLHPGQRPALIVFTQAVQAEGRWWTH